MPVRKRPHSTPLLARRNHGLQFNWGQNLRRGPSEAPRGFPRKRFFRITAYDRLKFYEHFAKIIFRSCEQSYTDADSKSAQIYKYRAFQVPPTQERPMTLADCDSDGRQIAPSRAHRAPWPGDTRYRLVSVSGVMLCVSIQSPALRGSGLSAALRAVIQQALSALRDHSRLSCGLGKTRLAPNVRISRGWLRERWPIADTAGIAAIFCRSRGHFASSICVIRVKS